MNVNANINVTIPKLQMPSTSNFSQYYVILFSAEKVLLYLKKVKPEKSQGNDKIHPFIIQKCANSLANPLSLIFQQSMDHGDLPKAWLEANVTPIFKKGSRSDHANYRPISLTSVICKLME